MENLISKAIAEGMINYERSLVILWLLMLIIVIIETIKTEASIHICESIFKLSYVTYQWLWSKDSGSIQNKQG